MGGTITKLDIFGVKPTARLHINSEDKHQSCIGGCFTILLILILAAYSVEVAIPIFNKENIKFQLKAR